MKTYEKPISHDEISEHLDASKKRYPSTAGLLGVLMLSIGPLYMALHRSDRMQVRNLALRVASHAIRIALEGDYDHTERNILFQGPPQ